MMPGGEESPHEASLGLLYHLLRDKDPKGLDELDPGEHALRRLILLADYAWRSYDLAPSTKAHLDSFVIDALAADRGRPWRALGSAPPGTKPVSTKTVDVAILTILLEEFEATVTAFGALPTTSARTSQPFYEASVSCEHSPEALSVVITKAARPLNVHAAAPLARLREYYRPVITILVGIAAGHPGKVSLGDVVVPRNVLYYEPARLTATGLQLRPEHTAPPDPYLYGFDLYDADAGPFGDRMGSHFAELPIDRRPQIESDAFQPAVHGANTSIASGEVVLRDGSLIGALRDRFDEKIHAVDQESYGFAESSRGTSWLIFRGISDYGDPDQPRGWKRLAAASAAHCLRDFLERGYLPANSSGF